MKVQAPPGMRDFYPADMRIQTWLFDLWRGASLSFGFEEYEGPIFEYLDLYTVKSGEAIISELFNFADRGQRQFAIRPEMTPTLARMVAARANALPRPIKWFSLPRMCRAEKPQRGRLREFFQWNADILGTDDVLADAEVIALAVEFLRRAGLTPEDVVVRVSSRPIASAALAALGIRPEDCGRGFQLIDRCEKLGPDEFARQWAAFAPHVPCQHLLDHLHGGDLGRSLDLVAAGGQLGVAAAEQFKTLWERLGTLGIRDFCEFDLKVVRGLAYYTGPVFELSARRGGLRALAGGGRYDNLTELLDGPRLSGVGFGMGDAPILELLADLGKLPTPEPRVDVFVIDAASEYFEATIQIASGLRRAGLSCDFSYKRQPIAKQFKQAAARGARHVVVVGAEFVHQQHLTVKNLTSGQQQTVPAAALLAAPAVSLAKV